MHATEGCMQRSHLSFLPIRQPPAAYTPATHWGGRSDQVGLGSTLRTMQPMAACLPPPIRVGGEIRRAYGCWCGFGNEHAKVANLCYGLALVRFSAEFGSVEPCVEFGSVKLYRVSASPRLRAHYRARDEVHMLSINTQPRHR